MYFPIIEQPESYQARCGRTIIVSSQPLLADWELLPEPKSNDVVVGGASFT